jgi:hypothetical protein
MASTNPFVGTWTGPDEYTSEVEYRVFERDGKLAVSAMDPSDGEAAEVSNVAISNDRLTFVALWPSTGRSARCEIALLADDEAQLTFTYTDHARLVRKAI